MKEKRYIQISAIALSVCFPLSFLMAQLIELNTNSSASGERGMAAAAFWLMMNIALMLSSIVLVVCAFCMREKIPESSFRMAFLPLAWPAIYVVILLIAIGLGG